MRKVSMIALVCALFGTAANADFVAPNKVTYIASEVITETKDVPVTVLQVKEIQKERPVVMVGNILQRLSDDEYLFQDETGSITIEIDDDAWNKQTVYPTDTVRIYGEVDPGVFSTKVDVDYLEKIQNQ